MFPHMNTSDSLAKVIFISGKNGLSLFGVCSSILYTKIRQKALPARSWNRRFRKSNQGSKVDERKPRMPGSWFPAHSDRDISPTGLVRLFPSICRTAPSYPGSDSLADFRDSRRAGIPVGVTQA